MNEMNETVISFPQLGANFAILLNQSNFSAFKFSNVSYCFAIKAIKHKISKVRVYSDLCVCTDRTVKLNNLAQKQAIRLYKTASSLYLGTGLLAQTKPNSVSSTAILGVPSGKCRNEANSFIFCGMCLFRSLRYFFFTILEV